MNREMKNKSMMTHLQESVCQLSEKLGGIKDLLKWE